MQRRQFLIGGAALIGGCASRSLADTSSFIAASDTTTEWRQYPCAAIYRQGRFELTFVGARHDADPEGATQALVRSAFAQAAPRAVIVEGFATETGVSPADAAEDARQAQSAWARGEAGLAVRLALDGEIPFRGGEPTQRQVYDALLAQGYSIDELFGGLVLNATIQSLQAGQLHSGADPRFSNLFDAVQRMIRSEQSLALPPDYSAERFYAWYEAAFDAPFQSDPALITRGAPDPSTHVGRMHIAWDGPRDVNLLRIIRETLTEHERVLVVYGGSHLTALEPALAEMLGPPTSLCGSQQR
ncbi:MAG: hypothetical protein ACREH4_06335 [Vitreimonas sp.]